MCDKMVDFQKFSHIYTPMYSSPAAAHNDLFTGLSINFNSWKEQYAYAGKYGKGIKGYKTRVVVFK